MNKKDFSNDKMILIVIAIAISIAVTFAMQNKENKPTISVTSNNEEIVEEVTEEESVRLSPELKVYFLDVGQGDSIFVQNGDNCMLIDAGNNPDGKYISKYLRKELGINKIDYLIGTHSHEDHIGGMDIILEDFEIGTFYMPDSTATNKTYTDVLNWAKKKNVDVISPNVGTTFNVGKAECKVMSILNNDEDENANSIVIELRFGKQKYLFTADMEVVNEESRIWNDIDVLKVSHHGSTYTSSMSFLKEVKPEIAIITCGKDNEYYYPHEAVLKRLKQVGCEEIHVTKDEGTILIKSDGVENKVENIDISFDGNM